MNSKVIAGVDEAGRGPLAGPVVASAVVLNPQDIPEGLRDSKKLSEKRRNVIAVEIKSKALSIGVGIVHEQDIDRNNILQATFEAMRQAISNLNYEIKQVQVDGNHKIPGLRIAQECIIGGDDLVPEISAASIIAKTTRDAMMISYDRLFPDYGFKSHKGYGSKVHMETLRELGRTPIHRRSFRPVDACPNKNYKYFNLESSYGRMGEIIAGMHLIRNGYNLLEHSYHAGRDGEIDLIASKSDEVIFVEVKSFAGELDDTIALERVTPAKQKQIARIAEKYLEKNETAQPECRFDIITVNFSEPKPQINHYTEAFLPL
ncbi:MAG: ribonuclease HII [Candidatus Marinimicrobia bacterium]|nr:ribonuclease HII [Candidatus Neomarinimicrobiota bacterium]MBT3630408.1 ribonuclease HII [Candidatus Neomarinimicrobiota bacterium]MBT3823727.1 ribonuclease HII [Candidatus Neomarinimicrobiota bacterium]MBT4131924.1 ribonuclease HII [Candidatus Neomarinimicrobiota bacterium]MBT4294650.1 ribonuclease HII [Candidatus Neomarinimicrobiota bacterium]